MRSVSLILKYTVTALSLILTPASAFADDAADLDALFEQLSDTENENWQEVENKIWQAWSDSGSDTLDLLLERGRAALQAGDVNAAIWHLSSLVDHAPEFAEGWNARATAYFQAGLYGPSINDIQVTLSLNPRHFGALTGLALIMEELGYPKDALAAYREVLAIHPHRPDVISAVERLEKEVGGLDL
ncbi:Tetratricopeptide repeat protein [Pseudoruegeria aquimaris]|uniref:Tetratricopeptide repeat protein n=1 Tax=Pseudoruegeria aquimaris TaxID=393663 RepID=A0A1Y5RW14_9RHOB|nr:tetratricopeptide repeat protein [Pseudoruegeria aquimaris]SLN26870.1 Tetratricopeptide repeat protein [Pseudoruegeria aquimaris]